MSVSFNVSAECINNSVKTFLEENKHLFSLNLTEDEFVTFFFNAWKNGFYILKDRTDSEKHELRYISSKEQVSLIPGNCKSICYGNKMYLTLGKYDDKYFILYSLNGIEWLFTKNNSCPNLSQCPDFL